MNDFVHIIEKRSMKMGYIPGSERVLFIKCGQGGSIYGYENKYLDIASQVSEKYGCSVFVSEIKDEGVDAFEREMKAVKLLAGEDCKVFCLGVSKGGLLALWHGQYEPSVQKIVTVNAPLMINFQNRTRPAIRSIKKGCLTMIYGTRDPSFKFVPFVEQLTNVQIIDGADHNLVGGGVSLMGIVESLLENSEKK